MTVRELIRQIQENTFDNEKDYELVIKDRDGNVFKVDYYDWCDITLVVDKL